MIGNYYRNFLSGNSVAETIKYFLLAAMIFALCNISLAQAQQCGEIGSRDKTFIAGGVNSASIKALHEYESNLFKNIVCNESKILEIEIQALKSELKKSPDLIPINALLKEKEGNFEKIKKSEIFTWEEHFNIACNGVDLDAYESMFEKYTIDEKRKYMGCLYSIRLGIGYEKQEWGKRRNDAALVYADKDFLSIDKQMTVSEVAVSRREKFSDEDYAKVFSEDNWYSAFHMGVKLMPKYDAEGNNEGFEETNFFGRFVIDSRSEWGKRDAPHVTHIGFNADFMSAHVINCEKFAEGSDERNKCDVDKPDIESLDFNDIANTVNASAYGWYQYRFFDDSRFEFGPGLRFAMQSREKLGENGDAINLITSYGVRAVFNDFRQYGGKFKNGMPRFYIELMRAKFDDYAGLGRTEKRYVASAAYRVKEGMPVYVGLYANGGKGPDEIAFTLTYGLNIERIKNFL